jgi:type II secretion system protein D
MPLAALLAVAPAPAWAQPVGGRPSRPQPAPQPSASPTAQQSGTPSAPTVPPAQSPSPKAPWTKQPAPPATPDAPKARAPETPSKPVSETAPAEAAPSEADEQVEEADEPKQANESGMPAGDMAETDDGDGDAEGTGAVPAGTLQLEGGLLNEPPTARMRSTRRDTGGDKVKLSFKETKVEDVLPFIVETTGKAVIVKLQSIRQLGITLVMDREVSRQDALDLLFQALRLQGIGVVETDKVVMLDLLAEVNKLQPITVLGPEVNVYDQTEDGNICIKVFRIRNTKAQNVYDRLQDNVPDYAQVSVDNNSNQIIMEGDIGLAKRFQRIIDLLDVPAYLDVRTETFKLKYADAQQISTIIQDLFAARTVGGGGGAAQPQAPGQPRQAPGQPAAGGRRGGGASGEGLIRGTSEQLVVTVLPATNSMTVRAEPEVMEEIKRLIATSWDVPITRGGEPFRLYDLKYTDPLKVKTLLQSLLEGGSGSSGGASRPFAGPGGQGGGRANAAGPRPGGAGGAGGESSADVAVSNVFRIEAYPDSNRLLVVTKTPDNFAWLDQLVESIDQPLNSGLPMQVDLKHANAVQVAEILNALLAEAGTGSGIRAPEEGLSGIDFQTAGGGTTGSQPTTSSSSLAGGPDGATGAGAAGEIRFPWQSSRGAGAGEVTEVSSLVGKTRVVPNAGQNSLLVLAPPEIQRSMVRVIEQLDRPGRQVMITAILAEVELGDEFAFGLRFGQAGLTPTNPNNAIVINGNLANNQMYSGSRENVDFIGDLTTSILDFGVPATVILQALEEKTNVRILQQPRVFTTDNEEAKFFDGDDVPFQTGQTTGGTTGGGTTSSFSQIAVGIGLNVRPRITKDRNVAMDVEVLYSNVARVSTATTPGNNPTISRRQTNTSVTVKNGQTIVLSGIRTEQEQKSKTKVPLLGDVPVLDWVFSSTENITSTSELVLFITPVVVDNPDENDTNFNVGELERLRALEKPMDSKVQEMQRDAGLERKAAEPVAPSPPSTQPLQPIETAPAPDGAKP